MRPLLLPALGLIVLGCTGGDSEPTKGDSPAATGGVVAPPHDPRPDDPRRGDPRNHPSPGKARSKDATDRDEDGEGLH